MTQGLEIIEVTGRRVLDSEGFPAVEAEVELENGARGRAMAALTVEGEASELVIEVLSECILFEDASDQRQIDKLLEESAASCNANEDWGYLTAVSMAVSRAAAAGLGLPLYRYLGGTAPGRLPVPMMTMISGGRYGRGNTLDMESFMVVPVGASSFSEGAGMCMEVYQKLARLLTVSGFQTAVGEEGGFTPDLRNSEEALEYITDAMKLSGYEPGRDMMLAIGAGADRLFDDDTGFYRFQGESRMTGLKVERDRNDMIAYYIRLLDGYPVCAVFDGLAEENAADWGLVTRMLGNRAVFIGQHRKRNGRRETERENAGVVLPDWTSVEENAVGISMCGAGSVTAAMEMAEQAKKKGLRLAVSHSCSETEDSFAADFAAAVNADWIRAGAPCRSERTSKYNELLRIEEWMNR